MHSLGVVQAKHQENAVPNPQQYEEDYEILQLDSEGKKLTE
jgi:hypothetical protein